MNYYDTLIEVADDCPADEALARGSRESRARNTISARATFLDAAEIARRLSLGQELAQTAAGYGGRHLWGRAGDDDRLVPLLEEGLDALGEDNVELRARLLARLAGALRDEHSRERRDKLSHEAVEIARRTQESTALAYALDGRIAAMPLPTRWKSGSPWPPSYAGWANRSATRNAR